MNEHLIQKYFAHATTASVNNKLIRLRRELGFEGIGIYWTLVERLFAMGGLMLLADLPEFMYEYRLDNDRQKNILHRILYDFDLFQVSKGNDAIISSSNLRNKETAWSLFAWC